MCLLPGKARGAGDTAAAGVQITFLSLACGDTSMNLSLCRGRQC